MCVCLPTLLIGCATSNEVVQPPLPDAPAGLMACAGAAVPPLPGGRGTALTRAQVAAALGDQRAAALAATRCAGAWLVFYDDLRRGLRAAANGGGG